MEKIHGLGSVSDYEKELLSAATAELKKSIAQGTEFVKQKQANL